ncbi:hypothetical protein BDB01DRAFT_836424 [Pilobolus umbonatus]|nr:hypothetical protein BDB01DRAFT_836424 [Pilobolus umbonatus]
MLLKILLLFIRAYDWGCQGDLIDLERDAGVESSCTSRVFADNKTIWVFLKENNLTLIEINEPDLTDESSSGLQSKYAPVELGWSMHIDTPKKNNRTHVYLQPGVSSLQ